MFNCLGVATFQILKEKTVCLTLSTFVLQIKGRFTQSMSNKNGKKSSPPVQETDPTNNYFQC